MKKVDEMLKKDFGNWKVVVFRKKGSQELLGFTT
jgi:hypothetical protein